MADRDHASRVGGLGDVAHVEEPFEVPPRCSAYSGQPRMVLIGVHRLLVVGEAGVLGTRMNLVEAYVRGTERTLGEINHRRVDAYTVQASFTGERECLGPEMLLGPEARALVGPDKILLRLRRPAFPPLCHAFRVRLVLVIGREDLLQVLVRRIDLFGGDEAVEQHPTIGLPALHLFFGSQS